MMTVDLAARAAADDEQLNGPDTVDRPAVLDEPADEIRRLERELADAQAALSEAEVEREKARKAATLKAEIEDTKRRRKEEAALAACEAKYGLLGKAIGQVDTIDGMVVVKKPDGIKVRKWQDQHGDNVNTDALRQLARPCVVYPELPEFDTLIAERPVALVAVATEVLKLAGLRLKELGGK